MGSRNLRGVEGVLMTVAEVAAICQVHRKTVTRAISRGELRAARLGARGAYRLRQGDVDAWLASRLVAGPAESEEAGAPLVRGFLVA